MWLSSGTDPNVTWIQYEFDRVYKLDQMLVWNYNSTVEPLIGFGIREATIEYSVDGTNWAILGTTHEFAQGPGADGYACNTTVDLDGMVVKYIKITANSNWGGIVKQYGLSEVRFLYIPVVAQEPNPASGATIISVDATLSWRAGREAATHNVYLSTDEQAVIDGTAPAAAVKDTSYSSTLDLAGTYYWRVDEVNDVETPTTWQGDVWSFSTPEFLVVDDFESYNDIDPLDPESHRIFESWIDGFEVATNGALIGYDPPQPSYAETTIVHDGDQAAPLFYSNTGGATYSEATRTFATPQNWARYGIRTIGLWFYGATGNSGQLYVKINGVEVPYDGDAGNLALPVWQPWNIDLTAAGVNLQSVTTLAIGFDGNAAAGTLYVDDIRLYSYDRQLITPVDPGTASLQAQYQFEGNASDSSGKGHNGTAMGGPLFAAGKIGQAISLDGVDDYVNIDGYKGILADANGVQQPFTITAWVKSTSTGDATIVCWGSSANGQRVDFRLGAGKLRVEHGNGNLQGNSVLADDQWHHVTVTVAQNASISYPAVKLYLDGTDDSQTTTDPDTFNIVASVDVTMGRRGTNDDRSFQGLIDDVRIYDRVLTQEEVASLAGRTKAFDKPF